MTIKREDIYTDASLPMPKWMIIFSLDLKEKKRETEKSAKEKIAWLPCVMQFSVVTLDCVEFI